MTSHQKLKVFELQKNGVFKEISEKFPFATALFDDELKKYMHYPQKGEYLRDCDKNLWKISNIVTDEESDWRVIISYIVKPTKLKLLY